MVRSVRGTVIEYGKLPRIYSRTKFYTEVEGAENLRLGCVCGPVAC